VHGYTEQQREHDQGPDGREWRRLIASAGQFVHHYNRQHQQGKNHGGDDDVGQSVYALQCVVTYMRVRCLFSLFGGDKDALFNSQLQSLVDLCQADIGPTVRILHFNRVVKNLSRRATSCSTRSSKPVLCRPEFKVTRSSFLRMNLCSLITKGILSNIQSLTLRQSLSEGCGSPATAFACNSILSGSSINKARKAQGQCSTHHNPPIAASDLRSPPVLFGYTGSPLPILLCCFGGRRVSCF
jgi:hypothetical protein